VSVKRSAIAGCQVPSFITKQRERGGGAYSEISFAGASNTTQLEIERNNRTLTLVPLCCNTVPISPFLAKRQNLT
jgi:hypothetical protein